MRTSPSRARESEGWCPNELNDSILVPPKMKSIPLRNNDLVKFAQTASIEVDVAADASNNHVPTVFQRSIGLIRHEPYIFDPQGFFRGNMKAFLSPMLLHDPRKIVLHR